MASPGLKSAEQCRADQQGREALPQPHLRQVRRKPLANHRPQEATTKQRNQERQLGRGPVAQGGKGHQGIRGDQQQARAAGELHRQARQKNEGRHDRKAAAHPGDAGEQTHQHALAGQRHGVACWASVLGGMLQCTMAIEQPGSQQSRCREDPQLHRLRDQAGLHQGAADPAAGEGRHPQHQGGLDGDLAAVDVGTDIAEGQQGEDQQRERNRGLGGQGRTAHQQGQQQDRAAGPEHGEQKADQGAARQE